MTEFIEPSKLRAGDVVANHTHGFVTTFTISKISDGDIWAENGDEESVAYIPSIVGKWQLLKREDPFDVVPALPTLGWLHTKHGDFLSFYSYDGDSLRAGPEGLNECAWTPDQITGFTEAVAVKKSDVKRLVNQAKALWTPYNLSSHGVDVVKLLDHLTP